MTLYFALFRLKICYVSWPPNPNPPQHWDPSVPLENAKPPHPYTRETGTIWQIGVLTAERSIFWPKICDFRLLRANSNSQKIGKIKHILPFSSEVLFFAEKMGATEERSQW